MCSTNFFCLLSLLVFFSLVFNGPKIEASIQMEKIQTSSNISSNVFLTTTKSYFCRHNYFIVNKL